MSVNSMQPNSLPCHAEAILAGEVQAFYLPFCRTSWTISKQVTFLPSSSVGAFTTSGSSCLPNTHTHTHTQRSWNNGLCLSLIPHVHSLETPSSSYNSWNEHDMETKLTPSTSLTESQKALKAYGYKVSVTNLSIVPHTLGILTANVTCCIIPLNY